MSAFVVALVDDGTGFWEFVRATAPVPDVRRLFVRVGDVQFVTPRYVEPVAFDVALESADAFYFRRVSDKAWPMFQKVMEKGIPVVVYKGEDKGLVKHEVNGYLFLAESWAQHWLVFLASRKSKSASASGGPVKVSVITPTFRRQVGVLSRCVSCVRLQTMTDWEHLICSDGPEAEPDAKALVESLGDVRVRYSFLGRPKREGDFGNSVRQAMLERARGEYVLFFDDDNLILPSFLERMMGELDASPGAHWVVCRIVHFGPLNESATGMKPPVVLEGNPVKLYFVDPLQVLVRRKAMLDVGWDQSAGYLSDGVTLERLASRFPGKHIPDILGFHL